MTGVVRVARSPHGWWEVRGIDDEVLVRYVSEFQAWEAGRAAAIRQGADLVIEQSEGGDRYEMFDVQTGTLRPLGKVEKRTVDAMPARWLILLVDDLLDTRELYAQYLTYAGFSVVTAINGHEALRLAELLHPDLILMDIRMPGMDGIEATADLKANPAVSTIPVVAITADESEDVRRHAREAGCTAFIAKPALPDAVARAIVSILAGEQRIDGGQGAA